MARRWIIDRISDPLGGFGPAIAGEPTVFGARRPGFPLPAVPRSAVDRWLAAMLAHDMRRVVCLLSPRQLAGYDDLLGVYRQVFGSEHVLWSPIEDFRLASADALVDQILPFLAAADRQRQRTLVHCSGGIGRTGHVLAAWLVSARGMTNHDAIAALRRSGRNARESGDGGLDALLDHCRRAFAERREFVGDT